MRIYTIGHSTRSLDELVALLEAHGVATLVDVRTVPRSRHNPQFNREALARDLPARGIDYRHIAELGGLRHGLGERSPNGGWRNKSFRGYADHMLTEEFARGIGELLAIAAKSNAAVMCAEAVPFRCHRSLIADALVARGVEVLHIESERRAPPHRVTPFARIEGERVTYPPEEQGPEQLGLPAIDPAERPGGG
jgi:uncharacterized protein (DUF488 family)